MSTLRWTIILVVAVLGCYAGPFACAPTSPRWAPRPVEGAEARSDAGHDDHWSRCPICRAAYEQAERK